jgi:2-oxoglutarate dehydrogenase E2 component (dihydrolipoamide succinyltransferase)
MSIELRVPQLPESVADATLVAWHKQPGESVTRDENLVDLETDKVVLEVPAPASGVLKEIRIANGTTVTSGQVLAILEEGPAAASAPLRTPGKSADSAQAVAARNSATSVRKEAPAKVAVSEPPPVAPTGGASRAGDGSAERANDKLAPAARRMAEEMNLDPAQIPGSGKDGRITKGDVIQHVAQHDGKAAAPGANGSATALKAKPAAAAMAPAEGARAEQRVPMTRLRARIAERLVQAQTTAAMLTTFNEVDMSAINEVRARYKDKFEKTHGVKLGFMSFFVRAAAEALRRFPAVNASIDGGEIVYHHYYDIGVAVSTDRGLMVPVLRDADSKSFAEVESAIGTYVQRAKDGAITIEELTGGTFTITNGGVFGSLMSTPILNMPQVAILGMHKIQDRPVALNGAVLIRPMMYLALTYDHRIVDGRESVQFLVAIKEALEDPARLLLQL